MKRNITYFAVSMAALIGLSFLLSVLPAKAQPRVHVVNPGDNIQEIIFDENTRDGDVILLKPGEHRGSFVVHKELTIRGEPGAVLQGEHELATILIGANNVHLENLVIISLEHTASEIVVVFSVMDPYTSDDQFYFVLNNCHLNGGGNSFFGIEFIMCFGGEHGQDVEYANIEIKGSVIENYDIGIHFGFGYYWKWIEANIVIVENEFYNNDLWSIHFQSWIKNSKVTVSQNIIESSGDVDTSIFFETWIEESSVQIDNNVIYSTNDANSAQGITLEGSGRDSSILIMENSISNFDVGFFTDKTMDDSSSFVIAGNSFSNNRSGIAIGSEAGGMIAMRLNSFTSNKDYGVNNQNTAQFNAYPNWWGHENGPTLPNPGGSGDAVSTNVIYNPWLAALNLATGKTGAGVRVSAVLRDCDNEVVDNNLLWVRFTVSGANNFTEFVRMDNGTAVLAYDSAVAGTDTITAVVLFAGMPSGLEGVTTLEWAPGSSGGGSELPRTGSGVTLLYLVLALLIAGAGVLLIVKKGLLEHNEIKSCCS